MASFRTHTVVSRANFDLEVPGASAIYVNGFDSPLEKQGDRFTGSVNLEPGETHLFAQIDSDEVVAVVSFQVDP